MKIALLVQGVHVKSCPICGKLTAYGHNCAKCGCHVFHPALSGTFRKGYLSRPGDKCPYGVTNGFKKAFYNAWHSGRAYREKQT